MGVTLGHRRYPVIKYLIVLLIVVGVALFLYKDKGGRSQTEDQTKLFNILGIGEFLLVSECLLLPHYPPLAQLTLFLFFTTSTVHPHTVMLQPS